MKIIISRKGFDASAGGIPSPIIATAGQRRLWSIPIPLERSTCGYADIACNGTTMYRVLASLRGGDPSNPGLGNPDTPHLDPDLYRDALRKRHPEWRPIFGQSGSQETQLTNSGVDDPSGKRLGDRPLFLFFGWYRAVELTRCGYQYLRGAPHLHAFFGWLQVETKILCQGKQDREKFATAHRWAAAHPHVFCDHYDSVPNAIYVAPKPGSSSDRLVIGNYSTDLPAAGVLKRFDETVHTLTSIGTCPIDGLQRNRRSHWRLPDWFYRDGQPTLGMNRSLSRWAVTNDGHVHLRSQGRGQEFVFETDDYPGDEAKIAAWVEKIVRAGQ